MKVRLLIGANAYAMIEESGVKTDLLLKPGRGAPQSLRETAADNRERAARYIAQAELAERAAVLLEEGRA